MNAVGPGVPKITGPAQVAAGTKVPLYLTGEGQAEKQGEPETACMV